MPERYTLKLTGISARISKSELKEIIEVIGPIDVLLTETVRTSSLKNHGYYETLKVVHGAKVQTADVQFTNQDKEFSQQAQRLLNGLIVSIARQNIHRKTIFLTLLRL